MPHPAEDIIMCGEPQRRVRLSVLTPFHRHDPSLLIERLSAHAGIELVLIDDGSNSDDLIAHVVAAAERSGVPTRVIVWAQNRGRSSARNRLIAEARGEYVLFLDADMIPDSADFLARWLDVIQRHRPFIAFGGMSLRHAARERETALHHFIFARSDCRPAWRRERAPAHSTSSSNLLVRRDLLADAPFDDAFSGWGWEDVEWAIRVSRHAPILHVDNPATHTGLDCAQALLRKSAEAGPNYGRMVRMHPRETARLASHRIALGLKLMPLRESLKRFCAWLACIDQAPLPVRAVALKTYRAAHYAEHLP